MARPLLLTTWSFGQRGNAAAWPALANGGSGLDAVETVCRVTEADAEVDSVGFGGLPDRDGAVTLDACIMQSPAQCGSVCAMGRHLHAVSIARRVMEQTPHVLLAGDAADQFADEQGFEGTSLLSDHARARWEAWKRDPRIVDQSQDAAYAPTRPMDAGEGGRLFEGGPAIPDESERRPPAGHDTVCVLALDGRGVLAGACSTSGMPFKLPGRVGDGPIVGQALYVEPRFGAAAATGTGELVMGLCSSFHVVEEMRRGSSPIEAIREVLGRVQEAFSLQPEHQVALIALTPDGTWSSGALREGYKSVVTTDDGTTVCEPHTVMLER